MSGRKSIETAHGQKPSITRVEAPEFSASVYLATEESQNQLDYKHGPIQLSVSNKPMNFNVWITPHIARELGRALIERADEQEFRK